MNTANYYQSDDLELEVEFKPIFADKFSSKISSKNFNKTSSNKNSWDRATACSTNSDAVKSSSRYNSNNSSFNRKMDCSPGLGNTITNVTVNKKPLLIGTQEFEVLRERENKWYPSLRHFKLIQQPEVVDWKRAILVDWVNEVCAEFLLQRRTYHLAVTLIDLYLTKSSSRINEASLQLIAVSSIYIASKYEEIYAPKITDFVKTTDFTYSESDILNMESTILHTLDWDICFSTHADYMQVIMKEWDRFATENTLYSVGLPQIRSHANFHIYQECCHLLDLGRLIDSHYKFNARVTCITILYIVIYRHLKNAMNTTEYNQVFNSFLSKEVDVCFDGLNFESDMLPCIRFYVHLQEVDCTYAQPMVQYIRKSASDYMGSQMLFEQWMSFQTFNKSNMNWVRTQYKNKSF